VIVPPRGSLRRKLLGVMLATTLVALLVALGAMIAYDLRAYHEGWVGDVSAQAELVGRASGPALTFDDARAAHENLALLRFQPKVRAAAIYNARGTLFATYKAEVDAAFPALPGADGVLTQQRNLVVFKRIVEGGQILGTVYLRADYELYDRVVSYAGIALLVVALAMAVAWPLSVWLQHIVTRPILAIGATARDVVAGQDYSQRVAKRSDDELGALVDAFNDMMVEIERRTAALEASNRDKAREVEERGVAQQEVMRLNSELERRVLERTAQLEGLNSELASATAAAESANRAKSEFLSNMSHELRTPLNAIIGFGQLLAAADKQPLGPERAKAFVDHIVNAGRHLLTLINDILNLAQIEAGKMSLSLESVGLGGVLDECRSMIEASAQSRAIRLLFPPQVEAIVQADRTRLKQVLLNLLSNAVKYNRDMGTVVVDCILGPQRVRVSVQDTGVGMRPEQVQALFQPFNRLGQETGAQEGTGIGLVVTKHLVEMMGGEIGVSSALGTGSLFWIELRATAPAPVAAPVTEAGAFSQENRAHDGAVATVLCVEDNPASLALIQAAISFRKDLRLLTAQDGQAGVAMARRHLPDVILMDNNMPLLSGTQAQELLKADPRTAGIPIIAISANAMPSAIAGGLAAGFFSYLTKPIEVPAVLEAVDKALAASAARKPA
jgi:signal transduction histidine kinase/ActR/RegA family two-component response regulator